MTPETFYLRMRRTAAEIRVHRPQDKKSGSGFEPGGWTSNRALRYFTAVGTFEEAHAWAIGVGNAVELRRKSTQLEPDYTVLPDGEAKKGWV